MVLMETIRTPVMVSHFLSRVPHTIDNFKLKLDFDIIDFRNYTFSPNHTAPTPYLLMRKAE